MTVAPTPKAIARSRSSPFRLSVQVFLALAMISVVGILIWQGIAAHGAPDPTRPNTSPTVAFLDIGVLVFREAWNAFWFSLPLPRA